MGYWDSFIKVWQVRSSIAIQESIENSIREVRRSNELYSNIPKIVDELNRKNDNWNDKLINERNKTKKNGQS